MVNKEDLLILARKIFVDILEFVFFFESNKIEEIHTCYIQTLEKFSNFNLNNFSFLDTYFDIILMTGSSAIDVNKEYECLKEKKMIYILMEIEIDSNKDNLSYFRNSNKQFKELCMVSLCDDFLKKVYICNVINSSYTFCDIVDEYIIDVLKRNYEYFLNYKILSMVNLVNGTKYYLNEHYDNIILNDIETNNNGNYIGNMINEDLHHNLLFFLLFLMHYLHHLHFLLIHFLYFQ